MMNIPDHFSMFMKQAVLSVSQLNYESINDVYEITTHSDTYIGKFMKRNPLDMWEKERFVRERLIIDLCSSNSIPVPLCITASGHNVKD